MVMMMCVSCGYLWNYRGRLRTKNGKTRLPFKVSCPRCKYPQDPRKAIENYKKKGALSYKPKTYFCEKCGKNHRFTTEIGKQHLKYKREANSDNRTTLEGSPKEEKGE